MLPPHQFPRCCSLRQQWRNCPWKTSNSSASLLPPLEKVWDSTPYGKKAKRIVAIYRTKYRFAHSHESQAPQLQPPPCLVNPILRKTTGPVTQQTHLQYEVLFYALAVKHTRCREQFSFFLAVLLKDLLVKSRTDGNGIGFCRRHGWHSLGRQ